MSHTPMVGAGGKLTEYKPHSEKTRRMMAQGVKSAIAMKPKKPGYTLLSTDDANCIRSAVNLSIMTLDHFTLLMLELRLDRPEQINSLERWIKNLKKLRKRLGPIKVPAESAHEPKPNLSQSRGKRQRQTRKRTK